MRELMTQWRRCELRRQHDLSSDNSSPLKEAQTSPEAPGDVEEMQNEVLPICPPWKANINEDPSGSWAKNSHVHPTINGWPSPRTRMTRTSPAASLSNLALSSSWPRGPPSWDLPNISGKCCWTAKAKPCVYCLDACIHVSTYVFIDLYIYECIYAYYT